LNKNRIRQTLPLLLLIISTMLTVKTVSHPVHCSASENEKTPLALGFGENERFVLYSDGEVHKLTPNQTVPIAKIDFTSQEVESAMVDFEVYGQNLYLYQYTSPTSTSGKTTITVYNLTTGNKTFTKAYAFTVTQQNQTQKVSGQMVLAASACPKAFAVITANTTHSLIEVFKQKPEGFEKTATYSGRMAMAIYRYNTTLLAATFKIEYKNNSTWVTPQITDIVENKTLFTLPALTPVAAMAYPFIQVFNRNNAWECHVTVYNPIMNRMEYYIVYPEKQGLTDSNATTVSPYMDYLITDQQKNSKITFKNGESITVNQKLSIIPQGAYIPLNPQNGTLDANPQNKTLLAKIVEAEKAKILYITEKSTKELYTLSAQSASKTEGFYAALTQNTAYIINPENHQLIKMEITLQKQNQNNPQQPQTTLIIAATATICTATAITISIRIIKKRKTRVSETSKTQKHIN
jgi:hypothetical protein